MVSSYIYGEQVTGLTDDELSWLRGFRCRDARCFKPIDRAFVLAAIRSAWTTEAAFDAFVQRELVAVLAHGKEKYSRQVHMRIRSPTHTYQARRCFHDLRCCDADGAITQVWYEVARVFDLLFGD